MISNRKRFAKVQRSMPHLHGDPQSHPLMDLENGRRSRARTDDDMRSEGASSGRSTPLAAMHLPGASLAARVFGARLSEWMQGPQPPRPYIIVPFGGSIQLVCLKRINTWFPQGRQRGLLAIAFFAFWLLSFVLVIHNGSSTDLDRTRLSCVSRFWYILFCTP
jgi:hypothetical protein